MKTLTPFLERCFCKRHHQKGFTCSEGAVEINPLYEFPLFVFVQKLVYFTESQRAVFVENRFLIQKFLAFGKIPQIKIVFILFEFGAGHGLKFHFSVPIN